ncbi:MAG: DUF3488 and transglutaminase-like domain-containing protein [Deltaproteobacteria bacterium]
MRKAINIANIIGILSYAITLCGVMPLFPWLNPVPQAAIAAGMLAGIWQDWKGAWPVKNRWLNAAIVPVFLFYALQFNRANAVQPVVSILAIMLAVRLGGEKSGRHYLQIHALSLFCLAASSLFDLSPMFLVYLALLLLLVAVSLVLLTFYDQDNNIELDGKNLRRVLAAGLIMPLASLPLLTLFFPILPRTQLPLWNLLPSPTASSTGFTDRVEPGRAETITDSRVPAFRAEMTRLPQAQIYWRSTVFNQLNGNRWQRDNAVPPERIVYNAPSISQTIFPEPGSSRFLTSLDAPASITLSRVKRSPDAVYEWQGNAAKRLGYHTESVATGILPVTKNIDRAFYLKLPPDIPPRIKLLADDIRKSGGSDSHRLELLEAYFRNNGYRYSMQGLPTGAQAIEQFLFDRKQGNCEFFASAFALVLRAAGIPARLIGGYLGGEYNQVGGYYLVSNDNAHVWVEAFVTGKGWQRFDPSAFALNAGEVLAKSRNKGLLSGFRSALDSLNHSWNRTVITYDFERQVEVAQNAGRQLQHFGNGKLSKKYLLLLIVLAAIPALFFLVNNWKRLLASREERILKAFYRRLERNSGIKVEPGRQGLFELAALGDNKKIREFVDIYADAVYRDRRVTREDYKRMKKLLQ